jgi:integrase
MARRKFDDAAIEKLAVKRDRYAVPDTAERDLYVRVSPAGKKTFVVVTRDINRKQKWITIGEFPLMKLDAARTRSREVRGLVKTGASIEGPQSFEAVANKWFDQVVKGKQRAEKFVRQNIDNHLKTWAGRDFESIRRQDIASLLDKIERDAGPSAADKILNIISRIASWYQSRHDSYTSPVVRGMRRVSIKEQARDRILNDDELRAIWKTAEANGQFGAFVRLLLLTGQRREKVATMKWSDVADGVWTIPAEKREKGNAGSIKLPPVALEIIKAQVKISGNPYVFAGRTSGSHFSGYSKAKKWFDKKADVADWRLHDLRRTARSLMSRAGVNDRHAEQALGHAINGVEGTYDRHDYKNEKAHALLKLAGLIDHIVHQRGGKVVRMNRK